MATEAELYTRMNEHVSAVEDIYAKGELTHDDRQHLDDFEKSISEIEQQIKDMKAREANSARHEQLNGKPTQMLRFPSGSNGTAKSETHAIERKTGALVSPGEWFAHHEDYQAWFKAAAPTGMLPQRGRIESPHIETRELLQWVTKGLLTSVNMAPLLEPDYAGLIPYQWQPLPIFGVITNGTTTSDTIEFARITGYDNQAQPVPEAQALTGTGIAAGVKPMSNMQVEPDVAFVRTIAHWIPATKRVLADVDQLRTLIDAFLREGLRQQLSYQIINGDGTGENFRGILLTPGIEVLPAGADALAAIRRARTYVQVRGRATPNAVIMHPANWEAVDLLQMATGQYFFGGPLSMGTQRIWGLPVVEDEAMPLGTALVGDFRQCILWNRQQATISATDSHADFFIRNLVTILGELRAAFAVMQPRAIVRITGLPGTAIPALAPLSEGGEGQAAEPQAARPVSSQSVSAPRSAK